MSRNDMTKIVDESLAARRYEWDSMCQKYKKRGEIFDITCGFSEINYRLFLKPAEKNTYKKISQKTSKENINLKKINQIKRIDHGSDDISDIVNMAEEPPDQAVSSTVHISPLSPVDCINGRNIDKDNNIVQESNPCDVNNQNSSSRCSAVNSTLNKLIDFVENNLKSNLRVLFTNRNICKLLECYNYNYWHKRTKKEIVRLREHLSDEDLHNYMTYCYEGVSVVNGVDLNSFHKKIIYDLKSNLMQLLKERELSRNNENCFAEYSQKIRLEWNRLAEEVPLDLLYLYVRDIIQIITTNHQE